MKGDRVIKLYPRDNLMSNWGKIETRVFRGLRRERQHARCVPGKMELILQNIRRSNDP